MFVLGFQTPEPMDEEVDELESLRRSKQPLLTMSLELDGTDELTPESLNENLKLLIYCSVCNIRSSNMKKMLNHLTTVHKLQHSLSDITQV